MARAKATKAEKATERTSTSLIQRERSRLRTMRILFAIFCVLLILSMVLSLAVK